MIENATIEKDYEITFKAMVDFLLSLGLIVNTKTKARGHQGFFLKNRIDISSQIPYKRKIEVLIHEFTHYIHSQIDSTVGKSNGSLSLLFPNSNLEIIENELLKVTKLVDQNKAYKILEDKRNETINEIKKLAKLIKEEYPDFKRSYPHKKIEKEIKKTDAKYLLKYDRVQVKGLIWNKVKEYSISTIDNNFPQFSNSIKNYIVIKSKQRLLKRIAARINRLNNYYKRPTELFARFMEALFIDTQKVTEIAPYTYNIFCKQLSNNKYGKLADFINKFF